MGRKNGCQSHSGLTRTQLPPSRLCLQIDTAGRGHNVLFWLFPRSGDRQSPMTSERTDIRSVTTQYLSSLQREPTVISGHALDRRKHWTNLRDLIPSVSARTQAQRLYADCGLTTKRLSPFAPRNDEKNYIYNRYVGHTGQDKYIALSSRLSDEAWRSSERS